MERRLAAILAADMVGYSRLMEADEEGTIARQKAHRSEVIDPEIAKLGGRTVKTTGDGLLVEFPSVVDALSCAVGIQRMMTEHEADMPEDRRIRYRIGINLGDIVIDGDDILGDGVNLAARLEGLAEPGGICLPRKVMQEVRTKLEVGFEFTGEQKVKNIETPVPVYRVLLDPAAAGTVIGERRTSGRSWQYAAGVAAALTVIVIGAGWWQPWAPRVEQASLEQMAFPLPDKPSIAVLPFTNLSEDPSQEYFADGMTEDLITDLSKISGLFVIARNSVFTYKGKAVKVRQVAEELGVRYVLEGSVRRAGDQVRINAQLIDATTGGHLWADRYDGNLANVFGLQDKVTREVVASLAIELGSASRARMVERETESAEAYEAFLRGWAYYRRNTPDDYAKAIPYFERALALDPQYSRAHAALAAVYWTSIAKNVTGRGGLWAERLGLTHEESRAKAFTHLDQALTSPTPLALLVGSSVKTHQGRHENAVAQAREALALDPNDPAAYEALGIALTYGGNPKEGADAIRAAMRLDPQHSAHYQVWLGLAEFTMERYREAAASLQGALQGNPEDDTAMIGLLAAYGHLNRAEEGKELLQALNDLRQRRQDRLDKIGSGAIQAGIDAFLLGPYTLDDVNLWPFKRAEDRDRLRSGLAKAGVLATAPDNAVSPTIVEGAITVSPADAKSLFDKGVPFVDVRTHARWTLGRIPGAILLDLKDAFTEASLLDVTGKDRDVVIYCEGPKCLRSSQACAMAVSWGFEKVYYLRLGFPGWKAEGYPVEVD